MIVTRNEADEVPATVSRNYDFPESGWCANGDCRKVVWLGRCACNCPTQLRLFKVEVVCKCQMETAGILPDRALLKQGICGGWRSRANGSGDSACVPDALGAISRFRTDPL